MYNIKFLNEQSARQADVRQITANIIEIKGTSQNTSGFHLLTDDGSVFGRYEGYTTLYRIVNDGFQLSNDGSVYVEPEPIEPVEPCEPTLENGLIL